VDILDVHQIVGRTPHMTLEQAAVITELIRVERIESVLELGFGHGVSTCYMASALPLPPRGRIVAVDLESARSRQPGVEELLMRTGLVQKAQIFYEPTSYTWRLMKLLEEDGLPRFDLCYLDGAHNWFADALAFFLVDRLLRPGGWIVLGNLDWTYAGAVTTKPLQPVGIMPEEERTTPQVRKVYDLLVKTHPSYHRFRVQSDWAFAQKRMEPDRPPQRIVTEHIVQIKRVGLGAFLERVTGRLLAR
jgi:predicted O-methyltransferase YrrM